MAVEAKAEIWAKRIIEMKASGMPQKEWCEKNGIKYNTIRSWFNVSTKEKKLTEAQENKDSQNKVIADKNPKWLKVSLEANKSKPPISAEIIKIQIGKFSVSVPERFDTKTFSNVMKSLLELC